MLSRKLKLATVILFFTVTSATAQEITTTVYSGSEVSPSDKYQIVQSHDAAQGVFRLDRACGSVDQLITTHDGGGVAWVSTYIPGMSPCVNNGRSHYQLFTSGIANQGTLLINTDSGNTWLLVHDQENPDKIFWRSFQ